MRWILFLFVVFLSSCSCSSNKQKVRVLRIGIDETWSPLEFGQLQPYINGYIDDLLLDLARYSGVEFEKISANWDSLYDKMKEGTYDAVFSSLPPYNFNQAKFDFTENFIELGPVFITQVATQATQLSNFSGQMVGILRGSAAVLLLEKYPNIVIRSYDSISTALDDVALGEIQGALLDRFPASVYVHNLYGDQLKIAMSPMTDLGLRIVAPKGKSKLLIQRFNESLIQMQKGKTLQELQKKWGL